VFFFFSPLATEGKQAVRPKYPAYGLKLSQVAPVLINETAAPLATHLEK
jgi:hypothetical protein